MKKNFKLMLVALMTLLPLAGWAQFGVGNYIPKGNFIYKVTKAAPDISTPGKVVLWGIRDGKNPVVTVDGEKVLKLEGEIKIGIIDEDPFTFIVDYAEPTALRNTYNWTSYSVAPTLVGEFSGMVTATSVEIPKEFQTVKGNQFYGYTNMTKISFQEDAQVTNIESGAFNTTQISTFDFSNCSKLTALNEGVFVEAAPAVNSYVKTITLPLASEALTSIGTAFQRLPNLTAINNLDQSLITTVEADAFSGDNNLKTLALPATVQTIAVNAFQGSSVENLTINVTSLNDLTAGNVYGTAKAKLKTLTLKGVLSKTFKSQAFQDCTKLATLDMTGMTINGGTIGASAFQGCTGLTSLTFNAITGVDGTNLGIIGSNAFAGCTGLTSVVFGNITGTDLGDVLIDANAFGNCKKLGTIQFGDLEHVTIGESAFKLTDDPSATATTLQFGTLTDVDINASAFEGFDKMTSMNFGAADGLNIASKAFADCSQSAATATLTFNTLKDVVFAGTGTGTGAFYNNTKLSSLTFGASENLTIQTYAFEKATSGFTGSNYASATFGDMKNSSIADAAFVGATRLNSVTIGDITDSPIGATGNVFPAVKTVSIGAVTSTAGVALINSNAFIFANQSGATLSLANGKSLVTKVGTTQALIAPNAFDFVGVTGGSLGFEFPVVTIGEIKTAKTIDAAALKGDKVGNIAKIIFNGNIATGALDAQIVEADCKVPAVEFNGNIAAGAIMGGTFSGLAKLATITFNGEIAAAGIATNAFKDLPQATITFNGKMAAGAVAVGAFENLPADSEVLYKYNGGDLDLNVNPFDKEAFKAGATVGDTRIIKFNVTNETLKAKYEGVNGLTTDGDFDIYLAYFFTPTPDPDNSFLVYPNAKDKKTAWARINFSTDKLSETLMGGTEDLKIQRVQKIDGEMTKLTLYASYTDEDDYNHTSTIYMIPLKITEGYYHIAKSDNEVIIAKVEKKSDFTLTEDVKSHKVPVNTTGYEGLKESLWNGLHNSELHIAQNIMTNQQLVDKTAKDGGVDVDIYRGGASIVEDLYIMTDPSKNKGFRIDMTPITSTNNAYINTGWYYMLLKHYEDAPLAANVVWMDDAEATAIYDVIAKKDVVEDGAIYTIQGIRVSKVQKGQIYIQNGKKFIAQ